MSELSLTQEMLGFAAQYRETPEEAAPDNTEKEETELIRRACEEKNALEELYIKYKKDVFAFSYSLYGNITIAEDCVQETFIRLPAAAGKFKSGCSEAAFILGIAKNVSRELYRSEMKFLALKRKPENEDMPYPQTGMLETVRSLPKKYRTIIMLRIISGMSFKEISSLLSIPESTARSRYRRAVEMAANEYKNKNKF